MSRLALLLSLLCCVPVMAQSPNGRDPLKVDLGKPIERAPKQPVTAEAPPHSGILEHASTGVVYVDKALLARYRDLMTRAESLRQQIREGKPSAKAAKEELESLREDLSLLKTLVEENKVLVEPYKSYSRRDQIDFDLAASKHIVITADNVRVRGWPGPGIRCVMEKVILSEDEPLADAFDAIRVVHQSRVADDWVGATDEDRDADEKKYFESDAGKGLSDQSRRVRAKVVAQIRDSYAMYKSFQGKEINTLKVEGLTFQEGNEMITGKTSSPGGASSMGGYWKRFAKLTVMIPPCQALAIRGCQEAIDIADVDADLVLTIHDSHDRDYGGRFVVDDVRGDVLVVQAPIRSLTNITGSVTIRQSDEFCDRSTNHRGKERTMIPADPAMTLLSGIGGDIHARILRTRLQLQGVRGNVDVVNEFGSTLWRLDGPVADGAHRVLSQGGAIEMETPRIDTAGLPIHAYTRSGIANTNFGQQEFEDRSFSTDGKGWHGFNTPIDRNDLFSSFQRMGEVLENDHGRSNGIDLISHGGDVAVRRAPASP